MCAGKGSWREWELERFEGSGGRPGDKMRSQVMDSTEKKGALDKPMLWLGSSTEFAGTESKTWTHCGEKHRVTELQTSQ